MKAIVNGEQRELPDGLTVASLLQHLQAPVQGVAVARNDSVVRSSQFAQELVKEGDRIEIIRAVAGG